MGSPPADIPSSNLLADTQAHCLLIPRPESTATHPVAPIRKMAPIGRRHELTDGQ